METPSGVSASATAFAIAAPHPELPPSPAIAAQLEAGAETEAGEVDDGVDPWADDASPSREPGLPIERDLVAVSWVPQPSRPI